MTLDIELTKIFLTLSIFVLMSFSLFVAIRYGRVNKWTYIMIPVILVLSMTIKTSMEDMLGYPTKQIAPEEQLYLTHFVGIEKKWIYIWAIDRNISWEPRAFKIIYTKENEKALQDAKEQQEAGVPIGVAVEEPPTIGGEKDQQTVRVNVFNKFTGVQKSNGDY